jgi:DNA-binding Xre family transcriptional regulator
VSAPGEVGHAVLAELRRRACTTADLMAATGMSRNAVGCTIRRARAAGYGIGNLCTTGSRNGALYRLVHDPLNPRGRRCVWLDCETLLSNSNPTAYCRIHQADLAYMATLERLCEVLDELIGEPDGQLQIFASATG